MFHRCSSPPACSLVGSWPCWLVGLLLSLVSFVVVAFDGGQIPSDKLPRPLPRDIPLGLPEGLGASSSTDGEVALGRRLFFDGVLSVDRSIACASCHQPDHGFADPRPLSRGVHGRVTLRNAPSLYNRALGESFMWDGATSTLRSQVLLPIENELEMGLPLNEAVARLQSEGDWRSRFTETYGAPPSRELLARSLAAFVARVLHGNSPVDRFRVGKLDALSSRARGGMWFFESRGGCWRCHSGPNFTDESFHNTGIGARNGVPEQGRYAVTSAKEDRGRFKTPTLRGLTETGPYMHDGSLATLEDVVAFYRKGGHPNDDLDPNIKSLEMSDADARNLVAFLRALSHD